MKRLLITAILLAAILIAGCTQTQAPVDEKCIVGTEDGLFIIGVANGSLFVSGPFERTTPSLDGIEFCQSLAPGYAGTVGGV